jgi:hypothetical protein
MRSIFLLAILIIVFGFINIQIHFAQEGEPSVEAEETPVSSGIPASLQRTDGVEDAEVGWRHTTNLSRSGAASQPHLLVSQDGDMQAFWWDRFDGLTTSYFLNGNWSDPEAVPVGSPLQTSPPQLFLDNNRVIHAFWMEGEAGGPLMHSRMELGSMTWSPIQTASESVLSFSVGVSPNGELALAFYRTRHTEEFPAGVYIKKYHHTEKTWNRLLPVHTSIYYRLHSPNRANIKITATSDDVWHVVWELPNEKLAMYASSNDGGASWPEVAGLSAGDEKSAKPRILHLVDNKALILWEDEKAGGCVLNQQELLSLDSEDGFQVSISSPQLVLSNLRTCPSRERFWQIGDGILWVWGEGSPTLTMSAFTFENYQWSTPRNIQVSFLSRQENRLINLHDLRAAIIENQLVVIGVDTAAGEVWVANTEVGYDKIVFSPPSTWSHPFPLVKNKDLGLPVLAVDGKGFINIIWSQPVGMNSNNVSLLYARGFYNAFIAPVKIVGGNSEEFPRQPSFSIDQEDRIHLVWSDILHGQILYRRAVAGVLITERDWLPAVTLASPGAASWPQIGMDASGRLYVVYLVPLNEGRGVYFVYSDDRGTSWSKPELIFDAAEDGWPMVDQLAFAVHPDGSLHAAFVKNSLPGTLPAMGIFYIYSTDRGETWSSPRPLAGEGSDWPQLALSNNQIHLLFSSLEGVWHRWSSIENLVEGEIDWSLVSRVPGWYQIAAPPGVAVDGSVTNGTVHLVGTSIEGASGNSILLYSTWAGDRWVRMDPFVSSIIVGQGYSASAAAPAQGGVLAVAWLGQAEPASGDGMQTLYLTSRQIPLVENIASQVVQPISITPEPPAIPVLPTTAAPTPTPDLNRVPVETEGPVIPWLLGGGLAALAVTGIFGFRLVWIRKK